MASAIITAAQWNSSVRDNLLATPTALATAANGYYIATGPNALAERFILEGNVDASETSSSTSFTSLATNGPLVAPTTGTKALVFVTAQMQNSTSGTTCYSSFEVTGATAVSPSNDNATLIQTPSGQDIRATTASLQVLTAGVNTFRMLYRCGSGGGTGTWSRRRITVIPL